MSDIISFAEIERFIRSPSCIGEQRTYLLLLPTERVKQIFLLKKNFTNFLRDLLFLIISEIILFLNFYLTSNIQMAQRMGHPFPPAL